MDCHKIANKIYNGEVIKCSFLVGNLVLYENERNVNSFLGGKWKFNPNWLGPYSNSVGGICSDIYKSTSI